MFSNQKIMFFDMISIRVCAKKYICQKKVRNHVILTAVFFENVQVSFCKKKKFHHKTVCKNLHQALQQTLPIQKGRDSISPLNSQMLVLEPTTNIEQVVVNACFQATTGLVRVRWENIPVALPTIMYVGDMLKAGNTNSVAI